MLDAYIQVLKKSERLERCLSSFRNFYPNSNIVIFSDCGDDLSELSSRYGCEYYMGEINTGISPDGFTKEQTFEWLYRFKKAFLTGGNPYVIYLEDDVLIRNQVNINFDNKISGVQQNPIDERIVGYFESKYGNRFCSKLYGTCGGSLYEKETFIKIFDKIIDMVEEDFDEVDRIFSYKLGFLDIFMPVFYMANGINYCSNDQLVETHRNPNWQNTSFPIVHGKDW